MDIGSLFLILAILIPVALFISRPFLERHTSATIQAEQDVSSLLAERDQVIASVKELDDDFNLQKIPEEIYQPQRALLLQNGVEILRQIDSLQSISYPAAAEDRLEEAIVAHRLASDANAPSRKNGNAVPPVPDDDLEQKIAARRRLKEGKAGGFCPKCGKPVQAIDRFCPKCGTSLA